MEGSKLFEGMWSGDLEDLVLPMINVDQFGSKVSDSAVVVGFYVNDKDAANDLNRFLQKSPITLLDTDVSPAPDLNGYYYVFVELLFDQRFGEFVKKLLDEVAPLANIKKWKMRVRGSDMADFDEKKLYDTVKEKRRDDAAKKRIEDRQKARKDAIEAKRDAIEAHRRAIVAKEKAAKAHREAEEKKRDAHEAHKDAKHKTQNSDSKADTHKEMSPPSDDNLIQLKPNVKESIMSFLKGSDLLGARVSGKQLVMQGSGSAMAFSIVGFEDDEIISENAITMNSESMLLTEKVRKMMGAEWVVLATDKNLLMQSVHGGHVLVLKH